MDETVLSETFFVKKLKYFLSYEKIKRIYSSRALSKVRVIVVVILVIGVAILAVVGYSHFELKSTKLEVTAVTLVGVCAATNYDVPHSIMLASSNVTVTASNTTIVYTTYSTIYASMQSSIVSYTTTSTTNSLTKFVTTSTSTLHLAAFDENVTVCTYASP